MTIHFLSFNTKGVSMSEETTQGSFVPIPSEGDPSLLLVKGKNGENKPYIKTLSHAVITVVAKYGYANLKCVGASAINNAMKSIVIASGEAKIRGVNLVVSPSFQMSRFSDNNGSFVEKTAMMLTVFDR
jgi:stage V sporulation protein SpoVS